MADEPSTEQEEKATARRTKAAAAEPQQQDTQDVEQVEGSPDVPVGQLIADSQAFLGYPSHTAAGALKDHDPDEMMSVEAAKGEVEAWLQKPVETEGGED